MSKQTMNPFQVELFQHLLKDIEEKHATNPQWIQYKQQLLNAIAAKSSASFIELLNQYHLLLFNEKEAPIEKEFFTFFQSQKFPLKLSRGLPRLYLKSNPSKSKLKASFSNLHALKELALDHFLLPKYANYALPQGTKICLFTYMFSDGWGDLIALKEAEQILQRKFQGLQLQTVVLAPEILREKLHQFSGLDQVIFYEDDSSPFIFPEEAIQEMSTADLIITLPTHYPFIDQLKEILPNPSFLSIGQYGFLESEWFHPKSKNVSMGLHFLEKGVFIRENTSPPDFRALENVPLLKILFGTSLPKQQDIEHYLKGHSPYFAYLLTATGGAAYLHTVLYLERKRDKAIDLFSPSLDWFMKYIQLRNEQKLPLLMGDFKIQNIEIHFEGRIYTHQLSQTGKKLRILVPTNLTDPDFRELLRLSNDFVAVRGDQSFSEAISANKLFFYDSAQHAKYFIKDLVALAESHLSQYPAAREYFRSIFKTFVHTLPESEAEWVEEQYFQPKEPLPQIIRSMVDSLRTKGTLKACKALNQIIQREHAFNPILCQLVQKEIAQRYNSGPLKEI